jgi:hypothetical protein
LGLRSSGTLPTTQALAGDYSARTHYYAIEYLKPLAAGIYGIEVSSPLPGFQSEAVRKIIGRNGENLSGAVRTSMGSKMVEYKISKVLK